MGEPCQEGWNIAGTQAGELDDSTADQLMIAQTAWLVEERYTFDDHPAWKIRCGPWTARLEWEEGPFDVGDRYSPPALRSSSVYLSQLK